MKELFSAFGSEVFRLIATFLLPGALAVTPGTVAFYWSHPQMWATAVDNRAKFITAAVLLSLFLGLILEDLGARLEDNVPQRFIKAADSPEQRTEEWYKLFCESPIQWSL